jgi:trimeric autotransporter adhesin
VRSAIFDAGLKRYVMTNKRYYLSFCVLFLLSLANSGFVGVTTSTAGTAQADIRGGGHGLSVSPSTLNFGNVSVGSSSVLTVTVTNSGRSTITISNTSVSGPGFNATGIPAGSILNPGQSAILNVTFAPAAASIVSGNVMITSYATNSPATISLSGTGVQPTGGLSTGGNTVTSITVTPANPTIAPGSQLQFEAIDNFGNDITSSVVWSSSNTSIAAITAGGLATGTANGSVTITATQ